MLFLLVAVMAFMFAFERFTRPVDAALSAGTRVSPFGPGVPIGQAGTPLCSRGVLYANHTFVVLDRLVEDRTSTPLFLSNTAWVFAVSDHGLIASAHGATSQSLTTFVQNNNDSWTAVFGGTPTRIGAGVGATRDVFALGGGDDRFASGEEDDIFLVNATTLLPVGSHNMSQPRSTSVFMGEVDTGLVVSGGTQVTTLDFWYRETRDWTSILLNASSRSDAAFAVHQTSFFMVGGRYNAPGLGSVGGQASDMIVVRGLGGVHTPVAEWVPLSLAPREGHGVVVFMGFLAVVGGRRWDTTRLCCREDTGSSSRIQVLDPSSWEAEVYPAALPGGWDTASVCTSVDRATLYAFSPNATGLSYTYSASPATTAPMVSTSAAAVTPPPPPPPPVSSAKLDTKYMVSSWANLIGLFFVTFVVT